MKIKSIVVLVAALGAVGGAQAKTVKSDKVDAPGVVAEAEGDAKADKKKKALEKYDEDGDGKLSDEEKAKMKEGKAKKGKKGKKEKEESGE
ncbi:MAG: hypothetical protein ABJQ29_06925 [Luteolibacter sp.]